MVLRIVLQNQEIFDSRNVPSQIFLGLKSTNGNISRQIPRKKKDMDLVFCYSVQKIEPTGIACSCTRSSKFFNKQNAIPSNPKKSAKVYKYIILGNEITNKMRTPVTTSSPAETQISIGNVSFMLFMAISPVTQEVNGGLQTEVGLTMHTRPKNAQLLAQVSVQISIFSFKTTIPPIFTFGVTIFLLRRVIIDKIAKIIIITKEEPNT